MVYSKYKKSINYLEFRDGYKLINECEIDAMLSAFREGKVRKNEWRVFSALHEKSALHKESNVDLYRAVNHGTHIKGVKRLSHKEIDAAKQVVEQTIKDCGDGQKKPVARKFLRYIAKGSASKAEAVLLLFYCKRRIRQPRQYDRLAKNERFARFTYRVLAELTGLRRATLCEGLARLVNRGLLNTAPVSKKNENFYGMLYIDGTIVSLSRNNAQNRPYREKVKTVTPIEVKRNAPQKKTVTLINKDPKTKIESVSICEKRELNIEKMKQCLDSPIRAVREAAQSALIELELKHQQAA